MYNDFVITEYFGFLMTVAKLYDDGLSIGEIAQKLKKDESEVNNAVISICMARESYRMDVLKQR